MINKTIFKKTIFIFSKAFESPEVKSSVRFNAIPNNILMKTIPNILFSTKAPKILLEIFLVQFDKDLHFPAQVHKIQLHPRNQIN